MKAQVDPRLQRMDFGSDGFRGWFPTRVGLRVSGILAFSWCETGGKGWGFKWFKVDEIFGTAKGGLRWIFV